MRIDDVFSQFVGKKILGHEQYGPVRQACFLADGNDVKVRFVFESGNEFWTTTYEDLVTV